jgi:hypothetical protein
METRAKVLVLVSSGHGLPLQDGKVYSGAGYYLNELPVPVRALMKNGYEITFANPKGNTPQLDVKVSDAAAKSSSNSCASSGRGVMCSPVRVGCRSSMIRLLQLCYERWAANLKSSLSPSGVVTVNSVCRQKCTLSGFGVPRRVHKDLAQ